MIDVNSLIQVGNYDKEASYTLGTYYKNLFYDSVTSDWDGNIKKAMYWLETSLKLGNDNARIQLIEMYANGWYEIDETCFGYTKRAIELIEEAEKLNQEVSKVLYLTVGVVIAHRNSRNEVNSVYFDDQNIVVIYYVGSLRDVLDEKTFESESIKYINKGFSEESCNEETDSRDYLIQLEYCLRNGQFVEKDIDKANRVLEYIKEYRLNGDYDDELDDEYY